MDEDDHLLVARLVEAMFDVGKQNIDQLAFFLLESEPISVSLQNPSCLSAGQIRPHFEIHQSWFPARDNFELVMRRINVVQQLALLLNFLDVFYVLKHGSEVLDVSRPVGEFFDVDRSETRGIRIWEEESVGCVSRDVEIESQRIYPSFSLSGHIFQDRDVESHMSPEDRHQYHIVLHINADLVRVQIPRYL